MIPEVYAMRRSSLLFCCLLLCLTLLAAVSSAQINPFRGSRVGSGLNDADLRAMGEVGAHLFQQDTVADGAKGRWSNPRSGNSGTLTVLQSFTNAGMPCRRVRYEIRLRRRAGPRTYVVNWCRTAGGVWKVT